MSLFADTRARSIGDIVSVVLTESTSAAKSADTDISKGADIGVEVPTLYGQPFDFGGGDQYNLSQSISRNTASRARAPATRATGCRALLRCRWPMCCPTATWWYRARSGSSSTRR